MALDTPFAAGERAGRKLEPIHVVIGIDHHYARGAAVTIRSLLDSTTQPERINLHVLDTGLTEDDKHRLITSWHGAPPPEFLDVSNGPLRQMSDVQIAGHVTLAGYARLFMPDVFPNLKHVWWVDSDLIFQGDFVELNNLPRHGKPIAAVVNNATPTVSKSRGVRAWQTMNLDPNGPFAQSGLVGMNLEHLRETGFTKLVLEVAHKHRDTIKGGDQEILNIIFGMRNGESEPGWAQLPPEWNDVEVHFADLGRVLPPDRIADNPLRPAQHALGAAALAARAKVIHVTEIPKVWDAEYWGPVLREIFDRFEARTAWSGEPRLPLGGRDASQAEYVAQVRAQSTLWQPDL